MAHNNMQRPSNNRKWIKRSLIASLLIFTGFVGGTIFGFTFHASYSFFGHTVSDGLLAVMRLSQIEKGQLAGLKMDLESDIDMALAEYSSASEEWWFPIHQDGWSLYDPDKFETYMRKAASYRKSHPSPSRDAFKNMTEEWWQNPENQELAEFDKDYRRRIDEMVKRYAE